MEKNIEGCSIEWIWAEMCREKQHGGFLNISLVEKKKLSIETINVKMFLM